MIPYGVQECNASENTIGMEVLTPLPTFAISHSNYCAKIPPKPRVLIIRDSISMVQITLYIDDKFQEGLFLSQYFQKC
jgi:hypothetical protein